MVGCMRCVADLLYFLDFFLVVVPHGMVTTLLGKITEGPVGIMRERMALEESRYRLFLLSERISLEVFTQLLL
jgi:hypothetical protein